jgi:hypothetical protein
MGYRHTRKLSVLVVVLLLLSGLLGASTLAVADQEEAEPYFIAYSDSHWVIVGFNWTPDADIGITVAGKQMADSVADENGIFVGGHGGASPGDLIVVTDGNHTTTHRYTNLLIERVTPAKADLNANTVTGTTDSDPGSIVTVELHDPDQPRTALRRRDAVVNHDRNWTADFSTAVGDEAWAQPLDLVFGMEGEALERDAQGNATVTPWWVPEPRFTVTPSPRDGHMGVGALGHTVWGNDWQPGAEVTVKVNGELRDTDPSSPIVRSRHFGWGHRGDVGIDTIHGGVQPGDEVTLSDGESTKSHVVTALTITHANPASAALETNIVKGTTDSTRGTVEVALWTDAEGHGRRHAEIQPDGSWMVDFNIAVDDKDDWVDYGKPYNLQPGSVIRAHEYAPNLNATFAHRDVADEIVTFTGYYAPLEGTDTVTAKAGQGVALKWNTFSNGVSVEDAAAAHAVTSRQVACELTGTGDHPPVADDAGNSSLRWDPEAGQYVFVWKTLRSWANTCREFTVTYQDTPLTVQVSFTR